MKLRKAIKLAAAGAVLGSAPMLAMAAAPVVPTFGDFWSTDVSGAIVFDNAACTTAGFTCDTANAIGGQGLKILIFIRLQLHTIVLAIFSTRPFSMMQARVNSRLSHLLVRKIIPVMALVVLQVRPSLLRHRVSAVRTMTLILQLLSPAMTS
jgi:hypothetical protein